jgi:RNA polymerase sigma factor (sigma-70 family)
MSIKERTKQNDMDELYIDKVCSGDTNSFRYFLIKYKDMAFSIAISVVKDEFFAEEVVQEAFINAFKGLKSFNKKSKFSTWFYRIVTNEAFKKLKKLKKEAVSFLEEYSLDEIDESAILAFQEEEQIYHVNVALKKLSPNESLALRLFYLQEESIKEICEITGWSDSKTKVTLCRARKNMHAVYTKLLNLT